MSHDQFNTSDVVRGNWDVVTFFMGVVLIRVLM